MQESKPISAYKQGLRSKIVETAMNDFRARGIRAVRMDDVAAELKISKRTLYEIFENKEVLLYEGTRKYHEDRSRMMALQTERCKNVMEIIMVVMRMKIVEIRSTNPQFYADLLQYPQVARFLESQKERIRKDSAEFFKRGKHEGYFRQEIDPNLISVLFEFLNKYVMEEQLYRTFTFEDIFKNIAALTMRGICTEKGLKILDDILKIGEK